MAGQRHENDRDVLTACSTLPSTPACIYVGNCSQITYIFMCFCVSIFISSFSSRNWDHDHTSHDSDTHMSWWLLKKPHQITIAQKHLTPSPHNPNWWYVMQNKWVESANSYSIMCLLYCTEVLISPYPDQEGNNLQRQKILMFIYPIYNHNWRNISTIYIYIYIYI